MRSVGMGSVRMRRVRMRSVRMGSIRVRVGRGTGVRVSGSVLVRGGRHILMGARGLGGGGIIGLRRGRQIGVGIRGRGMRGARGTVGVLLGHARVGGGLVGVVGGLVGHVWGVSSGVAVGRGSAPAWVWILSEKQTKKIQCNPR